MSLEIQKSSKVVKHLSFVSYGYTVGSYGGSAISKATGASGHNLNEYIVEESELQVMSQQSYSYFRELIIFCKLYPFRNNVRVEHGNNCG